MSKEKILMSNMKEYRINKITYNWFNGYCLQHEIGVDGVMSIREHQAMGEGDRWFYDVEFEDGRIERIFNMDSVIYEPIESEED